MEEIIKNLYVGDDTDYIKAKDRGYAILSCCKEGPNGHRSILGYQTPGAPHNKDYYYVREGNHLALNLVDANDPNFIPDEAVNKGIEFIKEHIKKGGKVLIHCNKGESRSGCLAMLYLRSIGELPPRYRESFKIFKTIYHKFNPGLGIETYLKRRFGEMKNE